jgi:hypothetical protein
MTEVIGVGRPTGRPQITETFDDGSTLHPDPDVEWLQCDTCQAGWLGEPDMDCPWCLKAIVDMRQWQAELVLRPPDIDIDDATRPGVIQGWGERLANAVKAGIVDPNKAKKAWERIAK